MQYAEAASLDIRALRALARLTGYVAALFALSVVGSSHFAIAQCGNGVVDAGEDCDDGGTCIGGSNAGAHCTAESDCIGDGVCVGGSRAWTACTSASACPGGACRHCVPQGGDGCARNCTLEHDVPFDMVPGMTTNGADIRPGSSGVSIASDYLGSAMEIAGSCIGGTMSGSSCYLNCLDSGTCVPAQAFLTIGKQRDARIPVVVKRASFRTPCINFYNLSVACIRGFAAQTCGGVLYKDDGVTLATDCTAGFTAGNILCAGKPPCTFVHGDGNTVSGEIGCDGLDNVNATVAQDSGGSSGVAGAPTVSLGDHGGPGSASTLSSIRISVTTTGGNCHYPNPNDCAADVFGADCTFCTDDDPPLADETFPTIRATSPAVTGVATAVVHNANGANGTALGPVSVSGAPFNCAALSADNAAGAGLVQAFPTIHLDLIGDVAVTAQFFAGPPVTPPATLTPTPTPTPTPLYPCGGDCDNDNQVAITELITLVNIALGNAPVSACITGDIDGSGDITIEEIIVAVNWALTGCRTPTPTPCIVGQCASYKFCSGRSCTLEDRSACGTNMYCDLVRHDCPCLPLPTTTPTQT